MRWTILCTILLLICHSPAHAKVETIYATYKYIMGDNDTKHDAKTLCYTSAKRRLLEKVGAFITSETEMKNYKITRDEVTSYSAAFLDVEVESEKTEVMGETFAIIMTLKTNVDVGKVKKILYGIINDASLKKKIEEKSRRVLHLENKIKDLQIQLTASDYKKSLELINERKKVINKLETENKTIKKIILAKMARDSRRSELIESNAKKVRTILQYVEIGMTPQEVAEIINEIIGNNDKFKKVLTPHTYIDDTEAIMLLSDRIIVKYWNKLRFHFRLDPYLHIYCLENIFYAPLYYSKKVRDLSILKDKNTNILLNKDFKTSGWKSHREFYRYTWGMRKDFQK